MGNNPWDTGQHDQNIKGLDFKLTSFACPEQYEVYKDDKQAAYVRLRHGYLYVSDEPLNESWWDSCTDIGRGERQLKGDGVFEDDEERSYFLNKIADIVNQKLGAKT